ncbi:MAG: Crp/Fnr family transcriptional regulator, partial [Proteobacteria bacterium]|nr:Crp/Fnr family transcriptional regulator [Pseudomonadota bacterium]
LCVFERSKLWSLFSGHPTLAYDIAWLSSRSERMIDDNLLAVGRRSARGRVAYLIVALYERCRALELAAKDTFSLPLTQQHIADALGLSLVHTNKTIRSLQAQKLLRWTPSLITIEDLPALRAIAHYDESDAQLRPLL